MTISTATSFFFFNQSDKVLAKSNQDLKINVSQEGVTDEWFKESHEAQLIGNSEFNSDAGWISEYSGDVSDVGTQIVNGGGNFKIIGEYFLHFGTKILLNHQVDISRSNLKMSLHP